MDIGSIIKAPLDDKDWIKKCLLMGLMALIPFAGPLNLIGWQVVYGRQRIAGRGTELPEANLNYIGTGFNLLLAMLPLLGLLIVASIVLSIVGMILGKIAGPLALLTMAVSLPLNLVAGVLLPVFVYRHIAHEDQWSSKEIRWAIEVVKANMTPVLMLWVTMMVIGFIGGLGMIALGLGLFLTYPLAIAMGGAAMAEFAKVTNRA